MYLNMYNESKTNEFNKSLKRVKFEKTLFFFVVIDILFLPYFPLIATNYSIFLVFYWYIISFKTLSKDKMQVLIIVLIILMGIATFLSFLMFPNFVSNMNIYRNNITKFIQYSSYLIYFSLFKYMISKYEINLRYVLYAFMVFGLLFASIYLIDIDMFVNLKLLWNRYDNLTELYGIYGSDLLYRFGFIWSDPNNPAYAFASVAFFIILYYKPSLPVKLFFLSTSIFIALLSMSAGAMLSIFVTLIILMLLSVYRLIFKKYFLVKRLRINLKHSAFYLFFLIVIILVLMGSRENSRIIDYSVFQNSFDRINNNFQDPTGGSRLTIWSSILQEENILKYLFLGHGSTTIINGVVRRTHSGQLYLIYSFGFIASLIYFYILFYKKNFKKWSCYIFIIPTVIGFTINTIMGEQKYIILHLLLMAIVSYSNNSKKMKV